jgi:hypothetical protein
VSSSVVRAYIAQVDRLLGVAQGLFPGGDGPGVGALSTGASEAPAAPPGASGLVIGAGDVGQGYRGSWTKTTALDYDVNAVALAAGASGQNGRTAASGIRQTALSAAAAIAPATDSPAAVKTLVSTMDHQLADMQREIGATKAQNQPLAVQLQQLADGYRALETAYVPPKPLPPVAAGSLCWIATKDGDVQRLCPSDTDTVTYVDDDGNYVAKTVPGGEITILHRPGPMDGNPTACWLPHAGADRSICGPAATSWTYPDGGFLVTEETGPDGKVRVIFHSPLGPLNP